MDRASDFGSEGWRFESVRAHYEHQGLTFVFSVFSFVLFEQFFLCLLELGELSDLHLDRHFR